MKKFWKYLIKNNFITTILIIIICSITYIVRENIEFKPQLVMYINLVLICILMVLINNSIKKHYIKWSYMICNLSLIFIFNRFYYNDIFLKTFHFELIYFIGIIVIITLILSFTPAIKKSISRFSSFLGIWVDNRNSYDKKKKTLKEQKSNKHRENKYNDIEVESFELKSQKDNKIFENEYMGNGKKVHAAIYLIAFIFVLIFLIIFTLVAFSGQFANIADKLFSENALNILLSLIVIFLLLVFSAGIIVSLFIKWIQIIIGIATNQHTGEVYFIFACVLFLASQYIFKKYPLNSEDIANFLIDGKLFTFPTILSILIPVFIIFAENIVNFFSKNSKIHEVWGECEEKIIRIAKGIVSSLLTFIEFVTSDYLSTIIEFTDDDYDEKDSR